jgi:hypothetical protein
VQRLEVGRPPRHLRDPDRLLHAATLLRPRPRTIRAKVRL